MRSADANLTCEIEQKLVFEVFTADKSKLEQERLRSSPSPRPVEHLALFYQPLLYMIAGYNIAPT